MPALTFIASRTPPSPVWALSRCSFGCDETATMDPDAVEDFCANQCELKADGLTTSLPGAVSLGAGAGARKFGNMADMPRFLRTRRTISSPSSAVAAEALGTKYTEGELAGKSSSAPWATWGAYSFNGNKIITTGTGGTPGLQPPGVIERAKHLSTQAKTDLLPVQARRSGLQLPHDQHLTRLPGPCPDGAAGGFHCVKTPATSSIRPHWTAWKGFSMPPLPGGHPLETTGSYSLLLPWTAWSGRRDASPAGPGHPDRPALSSSTSSATTAHSTAMDVARECRRRIVNIPCSTDLTEAQCPGQTEAALAL